MSSRNLRRFAAVTGVAGITVLTAVAPSFAATTTADDVDVVNTETVQIYMNADGDIDSKRVYEQLALKGKGKVDLTDFSLDFAMFETLPAREDVAVRNQDTAFYVVASEADEAIEGALISRGDIAPAAMAALARAMDDYLAALAQSLLIASAARVQSTPDSR